MALKLSDYKGQPCYEVTSDKVTSQNVVNLSAADVNARLPYCSDLQQAPAGFDPISWIKQNPLLAGGLAVAAYLIFKK